MDQEEIKIEEAAAAAEEAVETVEEAVEEAAAVLDDEVTAAIEEAAAAVDEAAQEAEEIPTVEGEAVRSDPFEAIKDRINAIRANGLPEGVAEKIDELKRLGFEVRTKSVDYAKKAGDGSRAAIDRIRTRSDSAKKQSRVDELLYQIGEAAYDGYKNGEDVTPVLEYLFRKIDRENETSAE